MPHHPTQSQTDASRANGRCSGGPRTEAGKARSSANSFQHGLRGAFKVLSFEDQQQFDALLASFRAEYQPATPTEASLVEKMAQHDWLSRRAQFLQDSLIIKGASSTPSDRLEQLFALYLRYQIANDRAFSKCLNDLLKLRAERRREEMHQAQVRLVTAKTAAQVERIRNQAANPRPLAYRPPQASSSLPARITPGRRTTAQPEP